MKCWNCKTKDATIKVEPTRSLVSPNSCNWNAKNESQKWYVWFCSKECENIWQKENYAEWAQLDRNSSDSECFIHDGWEKNGLRNIRIGRCKITGDVVRVEPMQPGDRSGQPHACYEHFELRDVYKKLLHA